jgi:hypothetical protein
MQLYAGGPPEPEILLGGDPEFEAYDPSTGNVVVAPAWQDSVPGVGSIGLDGCRLVAELRPEPAQEPVTLYQRIRALAARWEEKTGLQVCLSGHRFPIGCHIHIGTGHPFRLVGDWGEFIKDLDLVLGSLVNLSGAARERYRVRRAYEVKSWGVEYRTPPAAILACPELALWAFRAALAITRGDAPPKRSHHVGRAVKELRAAIRSGEPFTWELRRLERRLTVTLSDRDTWSAGWAAWLRDLQPRLRGQSVHFFGMAEHRGLATNWWRLAQTTGWALHQDVRSPSAPPNSFEIGLPYAVRVQESPDPLICQQILACLVEGGLIKP